MRRYARSLLERADEMKTGQIDKLGELGDRGLFVQMIFHVVSDKPDLAR